MVQDVQFRTGQRLAKRQRVFSRTQKGSKGHEKARLKVARCHQKIKNQRNDFLQKLSTKLIRENQVICLEDLSIKGMERNHKLAKSVTDDIGRLSNELSHVPCYLFGFLRKLSGLSLISVLIYGNAFAMTLFRRQNIQ